MPETNKLLSVDEFADKIKQKYPAYAEIENSELVNKITEKYPEYKSQVDFDGISKKKEETELPTTSSDVQEPLAQDLPSGETPNPIDVQPNSVEPQANFTDNTTDQVDWQSFSENFVPDISAAEGSPFANDIPELKSIKEEPKEKFYKLEDAKERVESKLPNYSGETDTEKYVNRFELLAPQIADQFLTNKVDKELADIERNIGIAERDKSRALPSLQKQKEELLDKRNSDINKSINDLRLSLENGGEYIQSEETFMGESPLTQSDKIWKEFTEDEILEKRDQIVELEKRKGDFFKKPEERIEEATIDNKDGLEELSGKGLIPDDATPEQALKILYQYKLDLYEQAKRDQRFDKRGTGNFLKQGGEALLEVFTGRGSKEKEFDQLGTDLESLAPIVLLNKSNVDSGETWLDVLGKGLAKSVVPLSSQFMNTNKDKVESTINSFNEIGLDVNSQNVSDWYGKLAEQTKSESGSFTSKGAAEGVSATAGFLLPFMMGAGIFGRAAKMNKYGRALTTLAKTGKVAQTEGKIINALATRSTTFNKIFYGALKSGAEFATTGALSADKDIKDEAFFGAGAIGGLGGGILEGTVNAFFGNKAKPVMGALAKYFGKAGGEVIQEFGEETAGILRDIDENGNVARSLINVMRSSDKGQEFMDGLRESFPNGKEASWFVLQTALMGMAFNASELGGLFSKEAETELKKLPPEDQKFVKDALQEVMGEAEQVTKDVLDGIDVESEVAKDDQDRKDLSEASKAFGEGKSEQEILTDELQSEIESVNGKKTEEDVITENTTTEQNKDNGSRVPESVEAEPTVPTGNEQSAEPTQEVSEEQDAETEEAKRQLEAISGEAQKEAFDAQSKDSEEQPKVTETSEIEQRKENLKELESQLKKKNEDIADADTQAGGKQGDMFAGTQLGLDVGTPNSKKLREEAESLKSEIAKEKEWLSNNIEGQTKIDIPESTNEKKEQPKPTETKTVPYKESEYKVDVDSEGNITKITSPKGKTVEPYTTRKLKDGTTKKVRNGNFSKIQALLDGSLTDNQIKKEFEDDFVKAVAEEAFNAYDIARLAIAGGAKVSRESVAKELGKAGKDTSWASGLNKEKDLPTIDDLAHSLWEDTNAQDLGLTTQDLRNAIIDVYSSYLNQSEVKESVVDDYRKLNDPTYGLNDDQTYDEFATEEERALFDSVNAEESLTAEEKEKYYESEIRKQFDSLTKQEQQEFFDQSESEGRESKNESVKESPKRKNEGSQKSKQVDTKFQSTQENTTNKSTGKPRFKTIGEKVFNKLINRLKKAFPNVSVITDAKEFAASLKESTSNTIKSKSGEVYGFVKDGKVYLDGTKMNANTPIHEFGHIWVNSMKSVNPKLVQKGIDLISGKAGKAYVDEVRNNPEYAGLTEEQIMEEALVSAIGDKGEAMFGTMQARFKEWLKRMYASVRQALGLGKSDIQKVADKDIGDLTLEEFTQAVVTDLTAGKEVAKDVAVKGTQKQAIPFNKARNALRALTPKWLFGKQGTITQTPQKIAEQQKTLYDGILNYAKVWKKNKKGTFQEFVNSLPDKVKSVNRGVLENAFLGKEMTLEDFGGVKKDHLFANTLNRFNKFRFTVQDNMIAVKKLQEVIKEAKNMMPDSWNFYQKKELEASKVAEQLEQLQEEILGVDKTSIKYKALKGKSLVERMKAKGIDTMDFGQFLYASHAIDFNNRARELKGNENLEAPSGMTDGRAREILASIPAEKRADMEMFALEFREKVIVRRLDILKDAGIIDLKTYNTLLNGTKEGSNVTFSNYVPLKVIDEAVSANKLTGEGLGRSGKGIQSIKGTDDYNEVNRYNPFFTAVNDLSQAIQLAERNESLKALADLVTFNKEYNIGEVVKPRVTTKVDDEGNVTIDQDFTPADVKKNSIDYYVDGKLHLIHITNEAIREAVVKESSSQNAAVVAIYKIASAFNNFKRAMLTGYNIDFIAPNLVRDLEDALFNISSVKGDFDINNIRRKIIKGIPSSMKAVAKHELGHENGGDHFKYMQEAAEAGMKMSWISYSPMSEAIQSLQDRARKIEKGLNKGEKVAYPFKQLGKYIMLLNSSAENATRLATYKALRESGLSKEKAASVAKNITINFEKKGDSGSFINALYLFANAGIQGVARGLKTSTTKSGQKFLFGTFVASLLNAALLDQFMDDEDDEEYLNRGYLRDNNTLLFNPLDPKNPIKIPKPYSVLRVPMNMGEYIYDVGANKMSVGDAIGKSISTTYSTLDPIAGNSQNFWSTMTPTVVRPLMEVGTNKDYLNKNIVSSFTMENKGIRRYERSNYKTPRQYEQASKFLYNNVGGFNMVSPAALNHMVEGYVLGGAPKVVSNTVSEFYQLATVEEKKELDRNKLMIIRRFYGDANQQSWRKLSYLNDKLEEGNAKIAKQELTDYEIKTIKLAWEEVRKNKELSYQLKSKIKKSYEKIYDLKLKKYVN